MEEWIIDHQMMYYKKLSLKNFRGFRKNDSIKLTPLTFLVGPNSSGKSSIFDALLLIAQSNFSPSDIILQKPHWAGPLVDLGSYKDTVYKHKTTFPIRISIDIFVQLPWIPHPFRPGKTKQFNMREMRIEFNLLTDGDDPIGRLGSMEFIDLLTQESLKIRYTKSEAIIELLGKEHRRKYKEIPVRRPRRFFSLILNKIIEDTVNEC